MSHPLKALALSALSVFGVRTEPQPAYRVLDTVGPIEIRSYGVRLAAEVTVPATSENKARGDAFNLLAGYIFGGNGAKQQIAMTAPVQTEGNKVRVAISPLQVDTSAARSVTMRFFLPAEIERTTAPLPDDNRVRLVEIPSETIAILRYSGGWSPAAVFERFTQLSATLFGSRWAATGEPFSFFYDPPFTLSPLRRNEAGIRVVRRGE